MSASVEAIKGNARSSGYERVTADWYTEPESAVRALLSVEQFPGPVHDPACGGGNIVATCLALGIHCTGSDLVDRARGVFPVIDFFDHAEPVENIITNPPFKCAMEFTEHALDVATHKVCVLQHLTWLEGTARYNRLWARGLLSRVWAFSDRVNVPPGGIAVKKGGGFKVFAWFVFEPRRAPSPTYRGGWIRARA